MEHVGTCRDPFEVRIHGRGGQGTVTFAALLAQAAFGSGWQVLGFPAFGTERTGAPVSAFVRLSQRPVRDRAEVRHPSLVVVQDPSLVGVVDVLAGLAEDGIVLLNATGAQAGLRGATVYRVAATDLAQRHLGTTKTSTAMLGFLSGVTGLVLLDEVCRAIRDRFSGEVAMANEAVARAAYNLARRMEVVA